MYNYSIKLVYWQLLLLGVHIGHSIKNSIIFAAWLIYTYRQNILIINLFKTIWLLKHGYIALTAACKILGPIWFINLNKNIELFITFAAKQAGEFSYTTYWLHGMISNWLTFGITFRKFNRIITTAEKGKFAKLDWDWHPWLDNRISWPRTTFISSVASSSWAAKECLSSSIPCLGIVDTNISGHLANIPIPGNDDSIDSLIFYNTHISQYILEKKFNNTAKWFLNIRRLKRLINFQDWILNNYINSKGYFNKEKIIINQKNNINPIKNYKKLLKKNSSNSSTFWYYGLKFFLAKNFGHSNIKEQVDIFYKQNNYKWTQIFNLLKKNSILLIKVINIFFIKLAWRNKKFLKKNFIKQFKLKFITGFYNLKNNKNFFSKRYLNNKIYKTYLKGSKLRFNKFILVFLKNYYFLEFSKIRGFWTNYSLNLINYSYLNYIIKSICNNLFNKKLYNKIIYKNKNINIPKLEKWNWFIYKSKLLLKKVFKNKNINKYKKYYLYYKNNKSNTSFFLKSTKLILYYYLFFFNFFLWNNTIINYKKTTKLLNFRNKYIYNNNQNLFNQNIKFFKMYNLIKLINILTFKKADIKNIINKYFFNINEKINNKIKKIYLYNKRTFIYNKKILKWDKQKKFIYFNNKKWFTNYKDKINLLYKKYKKNIYSKNLYINKKIYYNIIFKIKKGNNNSLKKNNKKILNNFYKNKYINKYKFFLYKTNNFNNKYFNKFNLYLNFKKKNKKEISKYHEFLINPNYNLNKNFHFNKKLNIIFIKYLILQRNWVFNKNYFKFLIKFNKKLNYYTTYNILYVKNFKKLINKFW